MPLHCRRASVVGLCQAQRNCSAATTASAAAAIHTHAAAPLQLDACSASTLPPWPLRAGCIACARRRSAVGWHAAPQRTAITRAMQHAPSCRGPARFQNVQNQLPQSINCNTKRTSSSSSSTFSSFFSSAGAAPPAAGAAAAAAGAPPPAAMGRWASGRAGSARVDATQLQHNGLRGAGRRAARRLRNRRQRRRRWCTTAPRGLTCANVHDEVLHGLLLDQLGEQGGPVRLHLDAGGLGQGHDVLGLRPGGGRAGGCVGRGRAGAGGAACRRRPRAAWPPAAAAGRSPSLPSPLRHSQ